MIVGDMYSNRKIFCVTGVLEYITERGFMYSKCFMYSG